MVGEVVDVAKKLALRCAAEVALQASVLLLLALATEREVAIQVALGREAPGTPDQMLLFYPSDLADQ